MRISDWSSDVCSSDLRRWKNASRGDGLVFGEHIGDRIAGEIGNPAVGRNEQPDRGEHRVRPSIEPVASPGGHADQVARLAQPDGDPAVTVPIEFPRSYDAPQHISIRLAVYGPESPSPPPPAR